MLIRILVIIILITVFGCTEKSKSEFNSQELLECVLWEFINYNKPPKNVNIFILDMQNWTDSSSYISIIIDTEGLYDLEGEYWMTSFHGLDIYQSLLSVDSSYRNPNNLTNATENRLKWEKYTAKKVKDISNNIAHVYDPPKIDFVYNTDRKCITYFFESGSLHKKLNKKCSRCN